MVELAAKALLGGLLVTLFALAAQTLRPQRFAGVLGAGPSVALASLTVTCLGKGPLEARRACVGMVAGAAGMVIYCLLATVLVRRWGAVRGAAAALVGWFGAAMLTGVAVTGLPTAAAVAVPAYLRQPRERPAMECRPRRLREVTVRQLSLRFGFGVGVSLVAGTVAAVAGTLAGGAFLAFPAVLLASLTLTAEEHGAGAACDQARGAVAGAVGMIGFAVAGAHTLGTIATPRALLLMSTEWVVIGFGVYAIAWLLGLCADDDQSSPAKRGTIRL